MIECVNVESNHFFPRNPIYEQHKLRYKSIVKRQEWEVPYIRGMEYDSYDTPAAHYLINRDSKGHATGVSRLCSTARPYMLEEHFPHLITKTNIPKSDNIWETTRFCVDSTLPPDQRKHILHKLVIGHLEFAIERQIENIIAVTYPRFWRTIFINSGWPVEWLGDTHKSKEGFKMIAGNLRVSEEVLVNVRNTTGIHSKVLNYGNIEQQNITARRA